MIRIGITEDISRLALAMKQKLELSPDFQVKFMAANGAEAIRQLHHDHQIDVLLMDIQMPEMDGIEATRKITERWPQIKIIMSTIFDDDQHLLDAIMAGAGGYLLKDERPERIHRSIYEILEGGAPMSPGMALKALRLLKTSPLPETTQAQDHDLTTREQEVLLHLSKGLSYEQIAHNLNISPGTIRKHVENIYRKLQVSGRTEALNKARKSGLL
jgi:DNA-binding NarL/FixJ family response regulator